MGSLATAAKSYWLAGRELLAAHLRPSRTCFVRVTAAERDELERLPSGWFKIAGESVWFWIEGVSDGQPAIP